jgi:hypothetical protein
MPLGGVRTAVAKPVARHSGSMRRRKLPPIRRNPASGPNSTMPFPPGSMIRAAGGICRRRMEHPLNANVGEWQLSDGRFSIAAAIRLTWRQGFCCEWLTGISGRLVAPTYEHYARRRLLWPQWHGSDFRLARRRFCLANMIALPCRLRSGRQIRDAHEDSGSGSCPCAGSPYRRREALR